MIKYQNSVHELRKILNREKNGKFDSYIEKLCKIMLVSIELETEIDENYFYNKSFEELKNFNLFLFEEIKKDNYVKSFANPDYSVNIFGEELGKLLASIYYEMRKNIEYAFTHDVDLLYISIDFIINLSKILIGKGDIKIDKVFNLYKNFKFKQIKLEEKRKVFFDTQSDFYNNIITNSNLMDLRYLFKYGRYISDEEIKLADFLNKYSEDKLMKMGKTIVDAFMHGFISQNRDIRDRKTVRFIYQIGQEQLAKKVYEELIRIGLRPQIACAQSYPFNKQYEYDHRFDEGLFVDEEYLKIKYDSFEEAMKLNENILIDTAGMIGIIQFGKLEKPPINKKNVIKLENNQNELLSKYYMRKTLLNDKYISGSDISFCKVGFPNVTIKENFEEVFDDFMEINLMESRKFEKYQQIIIDSLDKADYVHVKGTNDNQTDIVVKMKKIENPKKQTNFMNCGGDLNIPHGELFTTPVLKGTNGLLHLKEIFLKGYRYTDLKLRFENGYVVEYSCSNFENEEENKEYIKNTLLFPYDTIPMGEFSIGSNTLAYTVAKKHDIIAELPILLVEKMGPHFAIGDPCYARGEDAKVYNLIDGKEIIAKENERTALRNVDINQAYTNIHIDITLPYDDIEFLTAVTYERENIDIIKKGRFVLTGVEELNKPFEE